MALLLTNGIDLLLLTDGVSNLSLSNESAAVDPGLNAPGDGLDKTNAFLTDLINTRGPSSEGGIAHRTVELFGGNIVSMEAFEPDPVTFRGDYYYNTVRNILYRKVVTEHKPQFGNIIAHWKSASMP